VTGVTVLDGPGAAARFAHHVESRTVVLAELRVVFLPVPKAGCTSLLWLLAELAGLPADRFARSEGPEPSAALTVHDTGLWPADRLLGSYAGAERERVLTEPGWLRFAVVRDPAPRLWSAWQSKLLLREPRFAEAYGDRPWFPRVPERPSDLVEDFRAFVAAVGRGEAEDVHWSVQHDLVAQLPLGHVGHVERLGETVTRLRAHVARAGLRPWPAEPRRENRSPLPPAPHAYDPAAAAVLGERHAADLEAFGYAPPVTAERADPVAIGAWERRACAALPAVRATIDDRARLGQLHAATRRGARRLRAVEERLERRADRTAHAGARAPVIANAEGRGDFTVRWGWADGPLPPGFTAVVRVRNEARSLPFALPPLLRAADRVVVVDNGSTDGTRHVARAVAAAAGAQDRLEVLEYPFAVARCGPEHLATPAASVHSLVHFYNWSFAQVRTAYALKWDGDMVLTDAAVRALRDLAWQLEGVEAVVRVPRHPLYLVDDRRAYVDAALRNCEPWAWPNRPGYRFVKAMDWELPLWGGEPRTVTLPDWACVELKHLDADEFAHWSHTDFAASARTRRKQREWEVFRALAAGGAPPDGVLAVEAPPGRHVVDHVRETWLPQAARSGLRAGA
jgi:hypothetical protein